MKAAQLKRGDVYNLAQYPNGGSYVHGGEVPGTNGKKYYAHDNTIGHIYQTDWDEEVVRVGNIND